MSLVLYISCKLVVGSIMVANTLAKIKLINKVNFSIQFRGKHFVPCVRPVEAQRKRNILQKKICFKCVGYKLHNERHGNKKRNR